MVKTKGGETRTVSFAYDPFGRRIGKTLVTVINGVTKTTSWAFVYDGDDIALEIFTPPSGSVEKTYYTHGPGIDEHLALERNNSFSYYHADGLGSITAITDQSGATVQGYSYDSFGMVKPANTTFRNSYTYTGREWDSEAGVYYYRARYYDPVEGRFIGKDPIGFAGGDVNLFGYVQNQPINRVDPLGLEGIEGAAPFDSDNVLPPFQGDTVEGKCFARCVYKESTDIMDAMKDHLGEDLLKKVFRKWAGPITLVKNIYDKVKMIRRCIDECKCVDDNCKCKKGDNVGQLQY